MDLEMFQTYLSSAALRIPVLGAAAGALFVALFVAFVQRRRQAAGSAPARCARPHGTADPGRANDPHGDLARLESQVRALGATLVRIAARFDDLHAQLATDARHGAAATARGGADAGVELAVRLARAGARPEELVDACALRPDEARFLLQLHGAAGARSRSDGNHAAPAA